MKFSWNAVAVDGALPDEYSVMVRVTGWVNVLAGMETTAPFPNATVAGCDGLITWLTIANGVPTAVWVIVGERVFIGVLVGVFVFVFVANPVEVLVEVIVVVG